MSDHLVTEESFAQMSCSCWMDRSWAQSLSRCLTSVMASKAMGSSMKSTPASAHAFW